MALSGPRFDQGLQPERTELAWRRTVLAVAVGSLLGTRLLASLVGTWALGVGLVGLGAAGTLGVLAHARARRVDRALHEGRPLPGGGLLVVLAGLVGLVAGLAVLVVVRRAVVAGR